MITKNQFIEKLYSAAWTLMTHPGELSQRIQEASTPLTVIANFEELGNEDLQPIRALFSSVKEGDYGGVSNKQYQAGAKQVFELLTRFAAASQDSGLPGLPS